MDYFAIRKELASELPFSIHEHQAKKLKKLVKNIDAKKVTDEQKQTKKEKSNPGKKKKEKQNADLSNNASSRA